MTHPGDTTTLLNHSFQSHTQSSSAQRVFPNKVSQSESSPQLLTVLQTSPPPPLPVQHLAATDRGVEARVTVSCSAGQRCGWVRLMKCQMFWKVVKETQTQTDGGRTCKQDLCTPKSFFYSLFISLNKNNVHKLL